MEKQYKAVFFDLGGTLRIAFLEEADMRHARRQMAEIAGTDMPYEEFYQMIEERYEPYRKWALGEFKESGDEELWCKWLLPGVRMKQYNESALKIAKWLEANPKIETVRYPFLESNPQYAIAKKQMKGGGGMISFDVAGGLEAGKKFINSLKLCTLAVSLGDTETLVEQAAAMTHTMIPKEIREAAGITDGMIRMSVGLEDPDDIIADLKQALGD